MSRVHQALSRGESWWREKFNARGNGTSHHTTRNVNSMWY